MGDSDSGLGLIDVLTACTARTIGVDLQILRIDFDLYIVHLRQYRYGNGRGVDTTLGFGLRYTLYTVYARFKLEFGVSAVAVD